MVVNDDQLRNRQIAWAHTYDGYERLAGGPDDGPSALARVLDPAFREFRDTGRVPIWWGVDHYADGPSTWRVLITSTAATSSATAEVESASGRQF